MTSRALPVTPITIPSPRGICSPGPSQKPATSATRTCGRQQAPCQRRADGLFGLPQPARGICACVRHGPDIQDAQLLPRQRPALPEVSRGQARAFHLRTSDWERGWLHFLPPATRIHERQVIDPGNRRADVPGVPHRHGRLRCEEQPGHHGSGQGNTQHAGPALSTLHELSRENPRIERSLSIPAVGPLRGQEGK
jgi:hypothetical protein